MPTKQSAHVTVYTDEARDLTYTITKPASTTLTGASWGMRSGGPAGTSTLTKTHTAGIGIVQSGTTATVTVRIEESDTASVTAGDYYHELRMVDEDGNSSVVATGRLALIASGTSSS